MRIALVSALALVALVAAPGGTATVAVSGGAPTLRIGNGQFLVLVGAGFAPRSLVRVHVTGNGIDRRATIRATLRGGFITRFPGLDRCAVKQATARTSGGALVRVPPLIRVCPPPPPLAPGVDPA